MTAYLFAIMDVHEPENYEAYKRAVPDKIAKHGGRYIVRGGASDVVEGTWPAGRNVLLEFPDWGHANAFVDDPAYEPVAAIRRATTTSHIWIVDGVPDGPTAEGMHAYILGKIRMTDPDRYKPYAERVPRVLADANGTYLARGGRTRSVEGGMDLDRLVVVGFEDMASARAFHGGDSYAPLIEIRQSASESNIVIVEGL